jgi:hypothetical protein
MSATTAKKKQETCKSEYDTLQRSVLTELFKKLLSNLMPIEFKNFSQKFLKLKDFDQKDTLEAIIEKITTNQEMYVNNV